MNQHPVILLDPMYKWLDYAIAEYGLYIYLVMIWLSPLVIIWILKGGFWRRPARQLQHVVKPPPLPKLPAVAPPPLPKSNSDDGSQSFAA